MTCIHLHRLCTHSLTHNRTSLCCIDNEPGPGPRAPASRCLGGHEQQRPPRPGDRGDGGRDRSPAALGANREAGVVRRGSQGAHRGAVLCQHHRADWVGQVHQHGAARAHHEVEQPNPTQPNPTLPLPSTHRSMLSCLSRHALALTAVKVLEAQNSESRKYFKMIKVRRCRPVRSSNLNLSSPMRCGTV